MDGSGNRWRAFAHALNLTRFSIITLLAGAALLIAADQGRDLLIAIDQGHERGWFQAGMVLWAFSIWLWARTLLDINFPDPPARLTTYNFWRKHIPRLLGLGAFLVTCAAAYIVDAWALFWYGVVWGTIFFLFVIYRRDASNRLADRLARTNPDIRLAKALKTTAIGPDDAPPFDNLFQALSGMRGKFVIFTMLAGSAMFLAGTFFPVPTGTWLDAPFLFFLWGATWLPIGSTVTYLGNKWGVPLLTVIFGFALLFSLWNDNHQIRRLSTDTPKHRTKMTEALGVWEETNCKNGPCPPFLVVATAGGGIRAAYWTGTVLGHLHDEIPDFDKHLFAISGVSGGSLGAVVYRALITPSEGKMPPVQPGQVMRRTLDVLGKDFLGPLAAAMLYPDLTQRFLPGPWLPDRAEAFERALEKRYDRVVQAHEIYTAYPLTKSLVSLNETRLLPALFLNSTWVGNGRRIVASNLDFDGGKPASTFSRSNDLLDILGYDIRLSTAAHNSARFPFISPPGNVARPQRKYRRTPAGWRSVRKLRRGNSPGNSKGRKNRTQRPIQAPGHTDQQ